MKDFRCGDINELSESFDNILKPWEEKFCIVKDFVDKSWTLRLHQIIRKARDKENADVVVLVDNYDTPFIKAAEANTLDDYWHYLMGFYIPIKSLGEIIQFAILVGTYRVHYADNFYGGVNNLYDISTHDDFLSLCGFTKEELQNQMQPEIQALAAKNGMTYDEAVVGLQQQYGGYHFHRNSPSIFNPFSVTNALTDGKLANYRPADEAQAPLASIFKNSNLSLDKFDKGFHASSWCFESPSESGSNHIAALYQSGYLTIKDFDMNMYTLGFPNEETRSCFHKIFAESQRKNKFVNPGNEIFKQAKNSPLFVDKSHAIASINRIVRTYDSRVCVTRPCGFGKTTFANMLAAYYSKDCDSRHLFDNLKIANDPSFEKYLNKLNVIHFNVADFLEYSQIGDIVPEINTRIVSELKSLFPQVNYYSDGNLVDALGQIYSATSEEFIFIIDDYDLLIRRRFPEKHITSFYHFMIGLFKNSNIAPAIALVYITGILPVMRTASQSGLNNFDEFSMLDSYRLADSVGFTKEEVNELCKAQDMNFEECKRRYNGYNLNGEEIYNSFSVIRAMRNREFSNNQIDSVAFEVVGNLIRQNFEGILDDIKFMLDDGRIEVDPLFYLNKMTDFLCKDDVFTCLIHFGHLAIDKSEKMCYIPNQEVRDEWIQFIKSNHIGSAS